MPFLSVWHNVMVASYVQNKEVFAQYGNVTFLKQDTITDVCRESYCHTRSIQLQVKTEILLKYSQKISLINTSVSLFGLV